MSQINVSVPTASEATMASNLPAPGYKNLFYNTDDNNELYSIDSNGVISEADDAECCACEIAKKWMDALDCSLKNGTITAAEYQIAVSEGFVVTATETSGSCTVQIGVSAPTLVSIAIISNGLSMDPGDDKQLAIVATPTGANTNVVWVSSNPSRVTVSPSGLAHAVSAGTSVITAYSVLNGTITDNITITVS